MGPRAPYGGSEPLRGAGDRRRRGEREFEPARRIGDGLFPVARAGCTRRPSSIDRRRLRKSARNSRRTVTKQDLHRPWMWRKPETQLRTTRAQAIDVGVNRAAFEHAIAVLIGKPPAQFSLPSSPLRAAPPAIPPGLPSDLLERRPDIAASERRMQESNAQIGVAKSAYYPLVTLSGGGGFESGVITTLIQGPSGLWSAGANASEYIFDAGKRHAVTQQAQSAYRAIDRYLPADSAECISGSGRQPCGSSHSQR